MLAGQNYILRLQGFIAIILLGFFAYAFVAVAKASPVTGGAQDHLAHQEHIQDSQYTHSALDGILCQNNCASHTMCSLCFGMLPSIGSSAKALSAARFRTLHSSYHERFILLDPPPPKNQFI